MNADQLRRTLATNIRIHRIIAGMSQRELARLAGLSSGSVSAYEKGIKVPLADACFRIAEALGLSADDLFAPLTIACPFCGCHINLEPFLNISKSQQEVTDS